MILNPSSLTHLFNIRLFSVILSFCGCKCSVIKGMCQIRFLMRIPVVQSQRMHKGHVYLTNAKSIGICSLNLVLSVGMTYRYSFYDVAKFF